MQVTFAALPTEEAAARIQRLLDKVNVADDMDALEIETVVRKCLLSRPVSGSSGILRVAIIRLLGHTFLLRDVTAP